MKIFMKNKVKIACFKIVCAFWVGGMAFSLSPVNHGDTD